MTTPNQERDPRLSMNSRFTWLFLIPALVIAVAEAVGIIRPGTGDTWSEHHWKLLLSPWVGPPTCALLYWYALYHLPFGRWRSLGWWDVVAALVGVLIWAWVRHRYLMVSPL